MTNEANRTANRRGWQRVGVAIAAALFVAAVLAAGVGTVSASEKIGDASEENATAGNSTAFEYVEDGNCSVFIADDGYGSSDDPSQTPKGDDESSGPDQSSEESDETRERSEDGGQSDDDESPRDDDGKSGHDDGAQTEATGTESSESSTPSETDTTTETATATETETETGTEMATEEEMATESPTATTTDSPTETATATETESATSTETESSTEDEFDERAVERDIYAQINEIRRQNGLNTLEYDSDLSAVARNHSRDMAENDYFSHTAPDGDSFVDRYEQAGYDCAVGGGENIAMRGTIDEPSESAMASAFVDMWMNSSGHRENILRERWNAEGISVYYDTEDGEVYATQNFC